MATTLFKRNMFLYGHHDSEVPHDMFRFLTGKIWSKMAGVIPEVVGVTYVSETPVAGSITPNIIFLVNEPQIRYRSEYGTADVPGQGRDKFPDDFSTVLINDHYQYINQIGNFFSDEVIFDGNIIVPAKIIMGSDVKGFSNEGTEHSNSKTWKDYGYADTPPQEVWAGNMMLAAANGQGYFRLPPGSSVEKSTYWFDYTEGGWSEPVYGPLPDGTTGITTTSDHFPHFSIPEKFVVTTNLDMAEEQGLPLKDKWDSINEKVAAYHLHLLGQNFYLQDYNTSISTPFDTNEPWAKEYSGVIAEASVTPSYNFHMPDYESVTSSPDIKETSLPNQYDIYGAFLRDSDDLITFPNMKAPEAKRYMDFVNLFGRIKKGVVQALQYKTTDELWIDDSYEIVKKELVGPTRTYFANWAHCYPFLADTEKASLDDMRKNIIIEDYGPAPYENVIFDGQGEQEKQLYPMSIEVRFADYHKAQQVSADKVQRPITKSLVDTGLMTLLIKWSAGVFDGSVENAFFPSQVPDEYSSYHHFKNISFVNQKEDMANTLDGPKSIRRNASTHPDHGNLRPVRRLSYRSWVESLFKIAEGEEEASGNLVVIEDDSLPYGTIVGGFGDDPGPMGVPQSWFDYWAEQSKPIEEWSAGTRSIAWGSTIASGYYAMPSTFKSLTYGIWPNEDFPTGDSLKQAARELCIAYFYQLKHTNINHARTYQDILNGVLAYNEILFYRVEKWKHNQDGSKSLVQNIFKPVGRVSPAKGADDDITTSFIDTQVKYGEKYSYEVYAVCFVIGNKYKFKSAEPRPVEGMVVADSVHTEPDNRWEYQTQTELDPVIIEIPYYKSKIVSVLDKPPMPPGYDVIPYKDKSDRILINFESGFGSEVAVPVPITDEENYDDFPVVEEPGKIEFSTDDMVSSFRIYRLDAPPVSYTDFANGSIFETAGNATSFKDNIQANKTYYYTFKSVDAHDHLSNPTAVIKVELVNQDGMIYPIIEEYQMQPLMYKALKKSCQKYIHIKPAPEQATMPEQNINKMKMFLSGDSPDEGNLQDFSSPGIRDHSLVGRDFKVRIKSRKSGKVVDLNLSFEHEFSKPEEVQSIECSGTWPKFNEWLEDLESSLTIDQQQMEDPTMLGEGPTPIEAAVMTEAEADYQSSDPVAIDAPDMDVGDGNY